jgi:hypothetical protein
VDQIRKKINSCFKERNIKPDKENEIDNNKDVFVCDNRKEIIVDNDDKKFQFSLSSLHEIKSIEMSKVTNPLTSR